MNRPTQLSVFFGTDLVGTVVDTSPLSFEYSAAWLTRTPPKPLSAIPLAAGPIGTAEVQAYFENLLPEGELRSYLAQQRKASTLFAMLLEVAGDTAGGFVIMPAGQVPEPASYEATTWQALAAILQDRSAAAIDIQGADARISLAGAQDKASIAIFGDGLPQLPKGTAPSTHILKPNIRRLDKVWESAANEAFIMRTAAKCGLPVAEVFYEPLTRACVVRRFDRFTRDEGGLGRLIQYDLCQLSGTVSDRKYEKEGGPSLADCAQLTRRYSTQPAVDLRHLINWVFFNLYTGNNDSHAKNLSIYERPGVGVTLAPFYDLMCTRIYPGLSPEFAFAIGSEVLPGKIGRDQIMSLAQDLGVGARYLQTTATDLAKKMPLALQQASDELMTHLSDAGQTMVERLRAWVTSTTKRTAARIANGATAAEEPENPAW
jgi:serine/threonine-protein kinase HipA